MKILCRSSVFVQSIGFVQFPPLDTRAPPVSGIFFCTVLRVLYRKKGEGGLQRGKIQNIWKILQMANLLICFYLNSILLIQGG